MEEKFAGFLRDLADQPYIGTRSTNPAYIENINAAIHRMRGHLDDVEKHRTRVWRLDETGTLTARDLEEWMQSLNQRKRELEAELIAYIEERAHAENLEKRDADIEQLRRTAYIDFLAADDVGKNAIARAVSSSFGSMRLTEAGRILTGPKPDHVWLRKKHSREI